jgi:hypothetical protein
MQENHLEDTVLGFSWASSYSDKYGSIGDFLVAHREVFGCL